MINVNKRMYLTNQHKYVLSNQQDTGSMNIKGRTWENNKIQKHFDGTIGDNTAIVFKNLTKNLNMPHININLMQFNTFSTQIDIRSLTVTINEGSKGYLNVTYGAGYNSYTETLISNLPNSNIPSAERNLTLTNKFSNEETPVFGTIIFEPKSNNSDPNDRDKNSFRGVVTLTYKVTNKLVIGDQIATCKIYFLPYPKLSIKSIDGNTDFIFDQQSGTLIYPNPTKLPPSALKNEVIEGTYSIPIVFTNSFGIDDTGTYIENENMTPNQKLVLAYINELLSMHVVIPNHFNFMYFNENHFKVAWGNLTNVVQTFNVTADKNIYAGKIVIKSHSTICDTHNDIVSTFTFDNTQNIGYIKTIYSDVAPLTKVLSITKSDQAGVSLDLMMPKSNENHYLNFNQTITVIVKNQSMADIKIKINETLVQGDCSYSSISSSLHDGQSSLYETGESLYENENESDTNDCNGSDELYITDNVDATTQTIKPGNYAVFERVLFSPNIWEASGQTKIVIRTQQKKGNCGCK